VVDIRAQLFHKICTGSSDGLKGKRGDLKFHVVPSVKWQ